jgi:hypothetical protein
MTPIWGRDRRMSDSTAQFLDWVKKPMPGWALFEVMRRRVQALEQQPKPQPVKTVFAKGSMEWQAEQAKAAQTVASAPEPPFPQMTQR